MDLSRRLSRLRAASESAKPAVVEESVDPRVAELRRRLDGVVARHAAGLRRAREVPAPPASPPGRVLKNEHGELHVVEQWLEHAHCHGRVPIVSALGARPSLLAKLALDPALASVAVEGMLFLDTETTGLSGGTGTIPFLIGLARFEGRSLVVEQLILQKPGEEAPMLAHLAERIASASCLVSYNGKSFDWPLLASRFVLSRLPLPTLPPHLDLLHCARRIYKHRLARVRLVDMEVSLLGLRREADIDGAEIPQIYWAFVRGIDRSVLAPVIEHNANDLVALAALAGTLSERFEHPRSCDEPSDHLAFALVAHRAGDRAHALLFAEAAAAGADVTAAVDAGLLLARFARECGDVEQSLAHLLRALARDGRAQRVHLALAKLYEHRLRDFDKALHHARGAIILEGEQSVRRLARLEARLFRDDDVEPTLFSTACET